MTQLAAPDDPEDLWLVASPVEVPPYRILMQGDVILVGRKPVCVVSHACSMRRGPVLHESQIVAAVRDHLVADWSGNYDWMPLPCVQIPGFVSPAACLRELRSEATVDLVSGQRIAVMSDTGIHLLQQRMAFHLCRVVINLSELAEHSAPVLAEAELHEQWVLELGEHHGAEFHRLLDADDRKLRRWLNETRTRPQAMRAVRQEIRKRTQTRS